MKFYDACASCWSWNKAKMKLNIVNCSERLVNFRFEQKDAETIDIVLHNPNQTSIQLGVNQATATLSIVEGEQVALVDLLPGGQK